ncbi:MauE/DoxX family redox-associated membrane protein [Ectopseudomonas khazarica]|uniref:MauE/DoxX family redox-associated membrane protein n=1 Tax=Ectopseudomonas khazarica TaxID=2502979 RepID=UPI0037C7B621
MVISTFLHDPLVHLVTASALALLLTTAGIHKIRDRAGFATVLARYGDALPGPLPQRLHGGLVIFLPWAELMVAAGLLASPWLPRAATPGVFLLALYAAVLAGTVWRGVAIEDCGCHFGGRPQPPSMALVWRNLLLVLLGLNLLTPMSARTLVWFDFFTLLFALLSGAALYLLANLLISNRMSLREL